MSETNETDTATAPEPAPVPTPEPAAPVAPTLEERVAELERTVGIRR